MYRYALLQTQHYVKNFVDESINFLQQQMINVRQTVLNGPF